MVTEYYIWSFERVLRISETTKHVKTDLCFILPNNSIIHTYHTMYDRMNMHWLNIFILLLYTTQTYNVQ